MISSNALSKLANALLAGILECNYPNNPRNKKEEKKPLKYLFVSTKIVEKKDAAGVVHKLYKGSSCKRGEPKSPSKRDLHRQSVEK